MTTLLIRKILAVTLILSLVFGQSLFVSTMAFAMDNTHKTTSLSQHLCPHHNKAKPAKGLSCAAACSAFTQAMLPNTLPVNPLYAEAIIFEASNSASVGWPETLDSPPPRS